MLRCAARRTPMVIDAGPNMIELDYDKRPSRSSYHALTPVTVLEYLATGEAAVRRLGGSAQQWSADERGDGSLNLVFGVSGPSGALVLKQALPYVRMVGPSWPLSLSRSHFERSALAEQATWAGSFVPQLDGSDSVMALIIMEHLAPLSVLRRELVAGHRYEFIGGLAHVEGFEKISDTTVRAGCERNALALAQVFLLRRNELSDIQGVIGAARAYA